MGAGALEVELPGPEAAAEDSEVRSQFWRQSAVLATGWLVTNVALHLATLPLRFVLKDEVQLSAAALSGFFAIGNFSNYVKPVAGVMTDSIPLCGTRRRHYLLFSLLLTGLLWVVLALVPRAYGWMLPVYALMYIGVVFTSTTLGGVMVEVGSRFRAAGRLTAQRIAMFEAAKLIGFPLGGWLATFPFILPACAGGLLHLALIPFLMRFPPREPLATRDKAAWEEVKRQVRTLAGNRTLLSAGGMIFLLGASPGMITPLFFYQTNTLGFSKEFVGVLGLVGAGCGVLAATVYYRMCRRLTLRTLVSISIVLHTLGALCYLGYTSHETALLITGINGMTTALAILPVYDIAARATPRGSEAIGYALMMSMWNLTSAISDLTGATLFDWLGRRLGPLVWIDAVTTFLVIFAVPWMPKALSDREG